MQGGKNKQPLGYTIVEVLIVLAVSGLMFGIATTFINGKQEKTSFNEGIGQFASNIQDTIEQVADGQYSDVPLNCSVVGTSLSFLPPTSNSKQGTNPSCVFRGKLIHFYNGSQYEVISLADARADNSNEFFLHTAGLTVTGIPNLTSQGILPQSMTVYKFYVNGTQLTGPNAHYNVVFLQSLCNYQDTGSSCASNQSGAGTVELSHSNSSALANSSITTANGGLGETSITGSSLKIKSNASVKICVTDGTQYADINVGSSGGSALSVDVQKLGAAAC